MKLTKTASWVTEKGNEVRVEIERTRSIKDNVAYADGWNVNLGKKTVDSLEIEMYVNGKLTARASREPNVIEERFYGNSYAELKAAGAYARLGDAYITEKQYSRIMAAIEELEAQLTDDNEYAEIKAQEVAKAQSQDEARQEQIARVERLKQSGLCPKCGTWCYGDCEANA